MQALVPLNPHDVHLWHANLDILPAQEAQLLAFLNQDEVARAQRFHFPQHRLYFIAARGILRCILGAYLKLHPAQIEFAFYDKGKPYIPDQAIQFNVSHSHNEAVFALTLDCDIGVDIEKIEEKFKDSVAQHYFSPEEYEGLSALPEAERVACFYRVWSRKEALIKAIGLGLGYPLQSFTVPITQEVFAREHLFNQTQDWHLQSFEVVQGFASAFATQQRVGQVGLKKWII